MKTTFPARAAFFLALILLLNGCQPDAPAPPAPQPQTQTPAPEGSVPMSYIVAQRALVDSDFDAAKTALAALAAEGSGDLHRLAGAAAEAADIELMRRTFMDISAMVIRMDLPEGYAVAYCPMYMLGASWVQEEGAIANPYYGDAMLTCGEFRN